MELAAIQQLVGEGRLDAARDALTALLERDPGSAEASDLLIQVHLRAGDGARAHWEQMRRALFLHAITGAKADWAYAQAALLYGDLLKGWDLYEARLREPGLVTPERFFTHPRWDGRPFPGRTVLLHYEQGLGDTLMFIRYAPMVKALGGTVLFAAQAPLAELVATCPGIDGVIPKGAPVPPFDYHLPLLSLPWIFRTTLATIPAEIPYLRTPARVPHRRELDAALAVPAGRVRIGLVWTGSPAHPRRAERDIPAACLAPLGALAEAAWFSFYLGEPVPEPFPGIRRLGPLLGDFSDSAHACAAMDLVITADTSVAHLAGALGVPVLLMVTNIPDWRWLMDRDDSPWYPTLRLYRQPAAGAWDPVVQRILADLTAPAAEEPPQPALPEAPVAAASSEDLAQLYRQFSREVETRPQGASREWARSCLDLLFGRMPEAWDRYEARWQAPEFERRADSHLRPEPTWNGEPFPGRTLLLRWEQGFGDVVMFVRYAPMVKALGGTVLLEVVAPLADLVATCAGIDGVVIDGEPLPPFDLQLPLLSLPRIFRTDLASIPATLPYLSVPERVPHREGLDRIFEATRGLTRIGLAWSGNPRQANNGNRSIAPALLAPLAELPGVVWFSFHWETGAEMPFPRVVPLAPFLRGGLGDTAYALSGMDLVISVDTVIAHLAGALGLPTRVLLAWHADWRYLLDRDDSPWYPGMRLYRQPEPGAWEPVVQRLLADLQRVMAR